MEGATGIEGFTQAIQTSLSADALWGAITPMVPFIAVTTLFALGAGIFFTFRNKARKHR